MVRIVLAVVLICLPNATFSAEVIPHHQDRPPGPALSPAEAIQRMQVPPGFQVELVAAEPDIVNPVAMTFDERGRIWITESLEYPRKSAGLGRDRIKVLEDTDGDGKADRITVFADGLNIPSGIAVGHGGVWVANAPDILFLQDTDGDGKADRREVVVTGFGRDDTHELPNSLTWGPDGWLYGLNGVFNRSRVRTPTKDYKFTCAMFRIHPRTREFQVFCEGTSNPWGIAWDNLGSAFVSACVIDHLWHLTETGYYHRQGGPYPPFTWKLGSIVSHTHQKAAYCGIHYFDSDAYPAEYRDRLYMGNIHGGCVNVDVLSRAGSTYTAKPAPDFLTANDAWFMPVSQKTGPDGCLYILDWYDRYHCYQDARRDLPGIDRLKGRLYRIRYQNAPRVWGFDLARETDDQLMARLVSAPNDYYRSMIVRILSERRDAATRPKLERMVLDEGASLKVRLRALWALVGSDRLDESFHESLLKHREPALRAWAVRAAGNERRLTPGLRKLVVAAARDPDADVRLQAAIATPKLEGVDSLPPLVDVLMRSGADSVMPVIVWNNLQPLIEGEQGRIVHALATAGFSHTSAFAEFAPELMERLLAAQTLDSGAVAKLMQAALAADRPEAARRCLQLTATRIQNGELAGRRLESVRAALTPLLRPMLSTREGGAGAIFFDALVLAASWRDGEAINAARALASDPAADDDRRAAAFESLTAAAGDSALLDAEQILSAEPRSTRLCGRIIASLGRIDSPRVAEIVLAKYQALEPAAHAAAVDLLTQRVAWSRALLAAVGDGRVPPQALSLWHVRRILAHGDRDLRAQVEAKWGTIRDQRNPQRERVVAQMRDLLRKKRGDAAAGEKVFKKVCAQCHKIHGEGSEVGPEITLNGRSSFDQLLSNVFDPSLVIGAGYRTVIVITNDGRVVTGLLVEDSRARVVLKVQGGKTETIRREDIDAFRTSELSLMPEQIENQLTTAEIVDLFTFLSYDRHPRDPNARPMFGMVSKPAKPAR